MRVYRVYYYPKRPLARKPIWIRPEFTENVMEQAIVFSSLSAAHSDTSVMSIKEQGYKIYIMDNDR